MTPDRFGRKESSRGQVLGRQARPGGAGLPPMLQLQRMTGNRGVGAAFGTADRVRATVETVFGLNDLRLSGSVGREGDNKTEDVLRVRVRLIGLGFDVGDTLEELVAAIERYQGEVVGLRYPDGRVDPGGRTAKALSARRRPAAGSTASNGGAAAPAASRPEWPQEASKPETTTSSPAIEVPRPASTGPRPPLRDAALEKLVAGTRNPAVEAVAIDLAGLEATFRTIKRSGRSREELGADRDKLVVLIGELRAKIDQLDGAGLDVGAAAQLTARLHRALNAVSPFYFQHDNIILEYSKRHGEKKEIYNTCNITSLSMVLEALGRSSDHYKHKKLIPPIAEVYSKDIEHKADDKVKEKGLGGLRLPDYVAMCAIARAMRYKPGTPAEILAAGNVAFGSVREQRKYAIQNPGTLAALAADFGLTAKSGTFKLDPAAKRSKDADVLSSYGKDHYKQAETEAIQRADLAALRERLEHEKDVKKQAALEKQIAALAKSVAGPKKQDAAIEAKLPIEQYKRTVLSQIGPELDAGRQVIVGQYNHYVRLESIDEQWVVKDDPGGWNRGNMRITWEEARAMGLFHIWLSVG